MGGGGRRRRFAPLGGGSRKPTPSTFGKRVRVEGGGGRTDTSSCPGRNPPRRCLHSPSSEHSQPRMCREGGGRLAQANPIYSPPAANRIDGVVLAIALDLSCSCIITSAFQHTAVEVASLWHKMAAFRNVWRAA